MVCVSRSDTVKKKYWLFLSCKLSTEKTLKCQQACPYYSSLIPTNDTEEKVHSCHIFNFFHVLLLGSKSKLLFVHYSVHTNNYPAQYIHMIMRCFHFVKKVSDSSDCYSWQLNLSEIARDNWFWFKLA